LSVSYGPSSSTAKNCLANNIYNHLYFSDLLGIVSS